MNAQRNESALERHSARPAIGPRLLRAPSSLSFQFFPKKARIFLREGKIEKGKNHKLAGNIGKSKFCTLRNRR